MKADLQFDFLVDKEKNTITIKREFAAKRQLVWDCYTKSELLDRWFAPKPLTTKTKYMDFREGGHWLYAMVEPAGQEYWGRMDYQAIHPIDSYVSLDGFCDDTGTLNPEMPRSKWNVTFSDRAARTLVETVVSYGSPEALQQVINMGLKEGLASTLERLDELLLTLN
ncbi:SRPBCC family protein [Undibacterium sp. TJN25]|uniref:SRPBCC family protein n=1 Tax=Undibacterium sp. TJN25 TaxID=3413056 RepID=UPI003BF43534